MSPPKYTPHRHVHMPDCYDRRGRLACTGRAIKIGDHVERADGPPMFDRPRTLAGMPGLVLRVYPKGGSGGGKGSGSVRVLWASGAESSHDAHMLVRVARAGAGESHVHG